MSEPRRTILFLQGPISPFFKRVGERIASLAPGVRTLRVNLNFGDWLFWHGADAINYRGSFKAWPDFIDALILREGVTDVVMLGEQRPYHKAAAAAARARGTRVIATDFGYLRPDWIAFELDGLTGASRIPRAAAQVRAHAAGTRKPDLTPQFTDRFWPQARMDMAYHLSAWLLWFLFPGYKTHQPDHPVLTYLGSGLRILLQKRRARAATRAIAAAEQSAGPVFIFPMQMEKDFSIRAYSPYRELRTPICEVVMSFAAFAPEDATLIIKIHPGDPGLRPWRRIVASIASDARVADRVKFIDGGDLGRLIRASAGVVVINSTVGMLALEKGRPTLTLGQAVYNVDGMTASCTLDAFWQNPPTPDAALVGDFIKVITSTFMLRGTFYCDPGMTAGANAAARRLIDKSVNQPLMAAE